MNSNYSLVNYDGKLKIIEQLQKIPVSKNKLMWVTNFKCMQWTSSENQFCAENTETLIIFT